MFLIFVINWFRALDLLFRKMHLPTYFRGFQGLWKTIYGSNFRGLQVWNSLVWISLIAFINPEDFKFCSKISPNHPEKLKKKKSQRAQTTFYSDSNRISRVGAGIKVCFKHCRWFYSAAKFGNQLADLFMAHRWSKCFLLFLLLIEPETIERRLSQKITYWESS